PKVRIRDFFAQSTLDDSYTNGIFDLDVELRNHSGKKATHSVSYEILDEMGKTISSDSKTVQINDSIGTTNFGATLPEVNAWSAETPYLYTLVLSVKDASGKTNEVTSIKIGF